MYMSTYVGSLTLWSLGCSGGGLSLIGGVGMVGWLGGLSLMGPLVHCHFLHSGVAGPKGSTSPRSMCIFLGF